MAQGGFSKDDLDLSKISELGDKIAGAADKIVEAAGRLNKTKINITVDKTVIKDMQAVEQAMSTLETKVKTPNQKIKYFQSIENAAVDLKKNWNDLVKAVKNGDISSDKMFENKNATAVLRYANAFEALGGDISKVSPEISEFVNNMRQMDNYSRAKGYNFTVDGFKDAFVEFDKLREQGVSFNGFDTEKKDVEQLLSLSVQATSTIKDLGEQTRDALEQNGKSSMDSAINEQQLYQEELAQTREEIKLTREEMKKQLDSSHVKDESIYKDNILYDLGIDDELSDIEKYSKALDMLQEKKEDALSSATYWQNEIADYNQRGVEPKYDYNEWMNNHISDYHKYADQVEYIRERLQVSLKNFVPNADGNNSEAINALVLLLKQLNEQIEHVRTSFGTIDDESGVTSLLQSLKNINEQVSNLSSSLNGLNFNVVINDSGKDPIAKNRQIGKASREAIDEAEKAYEQLVKKLTVGENSMNVFKGLDGKYISDYINTIDSMDTSDSLSKQLYNYQKLIKILKEAASLKGIDLSSWSNEFEKPAQEAAEMVDKIESGANEVDSILKKIFGQTNNVGIDNLSVDVTTIIEKLQEMINLFQSIFATKVDFNTEEASTELINLSEVLNQIKQAITDINAITIKTKVSGEGFDGKSNISTGNLNSDSNIEKQKQDISSVVKLVDNYGRELDEVNSKLLEGTALLDEQGKLIRLYHGSDVEFDKFDLSFSTNESNQIYGKGAYLIESEKGAQNYGNVVTQWYANVRAVMDEEQKLTMEEARKLYSEFGNEFLSIYTGKPMSFDEFFNTYLDFDPSETTIIEKMKSLSSFLGKDIGEVLSTIGYDAIKMTRDNGSFYTIFDPDRIIRFKEETEKAVDATKDLSNVQQNLNGNNSNPTTTNENAQKSADRSKSSLQLEAELMEKIATSAREAADAKKEFVEANKQVEQSADSSASSLKNEDKALGKIAEGETHADNPKDAQKGKGKNPKKKDSSMSEEELKKREQAIERTVDSVSEGTDGVVTSVTRFKDSQDNLVKAQVKTEEVLDDAVKKTTTTINYNKKDGSSYSSDIDTYDYKTVRKQKEKEESLSKYGDSDYKNLKSSLNGVKLGNAIFNDVSTDSSGSTTIKFIEEIGEQSQITTVKVSDLSDALNRINEESKTFNNQGLDTKYSTKSNKSKTKSSNDSNQIVKYTEEQINQFRESLESSTLGNAKFKSLDVDNTGKGTITYVEEIGDKAKISTVYVDDLQDAVNGLDIDNKLDNSKLKTKYTEKDIKQKDNSSNEDKEKIMSVNQAKRELINTEEEYQSLKTKESSNSATDEEIAKLEELTQKRKQANDVINTDAINKTAEAMNQLKASNTGEMFGDAFTTASAKVEELNNKLQNGGSLAEYNAGIKKIKDSLNAIGKTDTMLTNFQEYVGDSEMLAAALEKAREKAAELNTTLQNGGSLDNYTKGVQDIEKQLNAIRNANTMLTTFQASIGGDANLSTAFANASAKVEEFNGKLQSGTLSVKDYNKEITNIQKSLAASKDAIAFIAPDDIEAGEEALKQYALRVSNGKAKLEEMKVVNGNVTATWIEQDGSVQQLVGCYDKLTGALTLTQKQLGQSAQKAKTLTDVFKQGWKNVLQYIASFGSFYSVVNAIKQGVSVIRELDTALTEMRKVSDESVESLKNFQKASFDIAASVGTTAQQIQNSTADWMGEILVPLYGNI